MPPRPTMTTFAQREQLVELGDAGAAGEGVDVDEHAVVLVGLDGLEGVRGGVGVDGLRGADDHGGVVGDLLVVVGVPALGLLLGEAARGGEFRGRRTTSRRRR